MNKRLLAAAMLAAMLSVRLASADDMPAPQPHAAGTQQSSQRDAACGNGAATIDRGAPDAPQNQVEYGGGA